MHTSILRRFTFAFALVLLALGTAGCGGSSSHAPTLSPAPTDSAIVPADPNRAAVPAQITLVNYSNVPGVSSTFIWSVTSSRKPAISHWVVGIDCDPPPVILSSNDPLTVWTASDPTTGVRGIKFDTGYSDLQQRTVVLVLAGDLSVGTVNIAIKAGQEVEHRQVEGPVCGGDPPVETFTIDGIFFFDANGNGVQDLDEPGIPDQVVTLSGGTSGGGPSIASTSGDTYCTTDGQGFYSFTVEPGDYTVSFPQVEGFLFSTASQVHVTVTDSDIHGVNGGVTLDYNWIRNQTAGGFTIGYWKTNLDKAIKGQTKGVQVSAATLSGYLASISTFALEPLNVSTFQAASDILSASSPVPASLLAKQLMGSEFNLMNGAYIGGNRLVTEMFVYQGEYLLKHASEVSSATLLLAKDRYDAYNNSHGGLVLLP